MKITLLLPTLLILIEQGSSTSVDLLHDFVIDCDTSCNLQVTQLSTLLFQSDSSLINIGYGEIDTS